MCLALSSVTHYLVLHITLCYTLPCVTHYLVLHNTLCYTSHHHIIEITITDICVHCSDTRYLPNVIQSTHHTQLLMLQAVCLMYVSANKSPRKCSNVFHMSHDNNFHWITTYKRHLKNITWWECVWLRKPTKK